MKRACFKILKLVSGLLMLYVVLKDPTWTVGMQTCELYVHYPIFFSSASFLAEISCANMVGMKKMT